MNHELEGMSVISVFPAKSTVKFTSLAINFFLESQEFEKKTSKSSAGDRKREEAISESTVKSQRIGITLKLEITDVL